MIMTESYTFKSADFLYLVRLSYIVNVIDVLRRRYRFAKVVVIVGIYVPRVELRP